MGTFDSCTSRVSGARYTSDVTQTQKRRHAIPRNMVPGICPPIHRPGRKRSQAFVSRNCITQKPCESSPPFPRSPGCIRHCFHVILEPSRPSVPAFSTTELRVTARRCFPLSSRATQTESYSPLHEYLLFHGSRYKLQAWTHKAYQRSRSLNTRTVL